MELVHRVPSVSEQNDRKKKEQRISYLVVPFHNFMPFIEHLNNATLSWVESMYGICTFDAYHLTECCHRYNL